MEFVDDIEDPNSDEVSAKFSDKIVEQVQYEKCIEQYCHLKNVNY